MNRSFESYSRGHREAILGGMTAGVFFVLVGMLFVITPNLFTRVVDFFNGFKLTTVPGFSPINISLPAPTNPSAHTAVYQAVQTFSFAWGIFLIVMLVLRYAFHTSIRSKADNFGDIVFWLGAGYLVGLMLNHTTTISMWFGFWAEIIILIGVGLITRAIVLAIYRFSAH